MRTNEVKRSLVRDLRCVFRHTNREKDISHSEQLLGDKAQYRQAAAPHAQTILGGGGSRNGRFINQYLSIKEPAHQLEV